MPRGEKSAELRLRTFIARFPIGHPVRLKLDGPEGMEGLVTGVEFLIGAESYTVGWSDRETTKHAGIELVSSADPDPAEPEGDS